MEQPSAEQVQEPQEDPIVAQERAYQQQLFNSLFSIPKEVYVPEELSKVIPATEQYITSLRFSSNGKRDVLAVTNSKVYKLSDQYKKKWSFSVRDIYQVKIVEGKTLLIDFLKKVNNDGINMTCEIFKTVLTSLAFESWQAYFESKIMPSPDIYQAHYFGHRKGDKKKICVALSNKKLFITDVKGSATPADTKDIAPYEFFHKLQTSDESLTVTISTSIRSLTEIAFVLFDKDSYDDIVYKLQSLYFYDRKVRLEKVSKHHHKGSSRK